LIVLAVYGLGRRFGLHERSALAAGAVAGLLPGIATVQLESFLSQALAIPLLLIFPVFLDDLVERLDWRRLSICAIVAAAIVSIYTEFWIILLGLTTLMLGIAALGPPRTWRLLGCWGALILAPFALNPLFTTMVIEIFTRLDVPLITHLYPWALSIEGIGRLWLGDLAAASSSPQFLIRTYAFAATALGYYGLMHMCISRLSGGHATGAAPEQRRALGFALGVLALALLPVVVLARDSQHPYQFYKLLLSISPLLVLGLALALRPDLSAVAGAPIVRPAGRVALLQKLPALLVMSIALAGSVVGTTTMVIQSTSLQPAERYAANYLITPEMQQLQERLEGLHDSNLFYYEVDTTWSTGFVNAWLAYFARHNRIWLGNPRFNGVDLAAIPEIRSIVDLKTVPPDVLVLSHVDKGVAALPTKKTLLWSNSSYQLWKPDIAFWALLEQVQNRYGVQQLKGEPFFWMGKEPTQLQVYAIQAGRLTLQARFQPGPSLPGTTVRRVLVESDTGHREEISIAVGEQRIEVPVPPGLTTISLTALDTPTLTKLANGDRRTLLLGVQGLTVRLDPSIDQ
ncbi:MAG: hypothetical protein ACJ8CR_05995, partial [Roseiflexaceae bacterium]